MTMNNNNFETTDLGLAASLTACGFKVTAVDKSNPRRVIFWFENTPELISKVEQFWSQELLLPASLILEQIRQLKARIYS